MFINGIFFISKCCMSEVKNPQPKLYVCKRCEEACDLIESATPPEDPESGEEIMG